MTETHAELDAALDEVVIAARAHLAAIKAADGEPNDEAVWEAYVALNNASHAYDHALNDAFAEVTPWDLEEITGDEAQGRRGADELALADGLGLPADDPYPTVISVRQRRDYRVPSVAALLALAEAGRAAIGEAGSEPISSVADAVLELLQVGDGSLGMLDVPELDPLDGVVVVAEVAQALRPADDDTDGEAPFRLGAEDRAVGRLDERALLDGLDDED
jgi:hypothetical protein